MYSCLVVEQKGQACKIYIADPSGSSKNKCLAYAIKDAQMQTDALQAINDAPYKITQNLSAASLEELQAYFDKWHTEYCDSRVNIVVNLVFAVIFVLMMIPIVFFGLANTLMMIFIIPIFAFTLTQRLL